MSAIFIDLAAFVFGLGTNDAIGDRTSIGSGHAIDIDVPGTGWSALVAIEDTAFKAKTIVIETAPIGSAADITAVLAGHSGHDTLFAAACATTGLDTADTLTPATGAGLCRLASSGTWFSDDLGLADVRLSPAPLFAALAQRQVRHEQLKVA